jgi:hypothetical protein
MSDEQKTEVRQLVDFRGIVLNAYGEMTIEQGDESSITLEADESVLEKLKTEVVGGELRVSIVGSWFTRFKTAAKAGLTSQKIRYLVKLRDLDRLEVSDAASVSCPSLKTDSLAMMVDGAGYVRFGWIEGRKLSVALPGASNVEIAGVVEEQKIDMGGLGKYESPRLRSGKAAVEVRGAGQVVVVATEELDVIIRGLGHVGYYGNPRVNRDISGLGKIERLGEAPAAT